MNLDATPDVHLRQALEPDERLHLQAPAADATLAITDRRLIVAASTRIALAVAFDGVRRIQFDVERRRPATLVIVPEHPSDEAQVLTIRPEEYEAASQAIVAIGLELARLGDDDGAPTAQA
jgi:hypothetical protein